MLKPEPNARSATAVTTQMQAHCRQILQSLEAGDPTHPDTTRTDTWTVGVTSCRGGAGSSTLAANLAVASAQAGRGPVLLIDAHLRRPAQHRLFRLPLAPGLAEALAASSPAVLPAEATAVDQLRLLPAGDAGGGRPADFSLFPDYLAAAAGEFRHVIVDLPPAASCGGCPAMLHALDGVLLVAEARRTKVAAVAEARRTLDLAGTQVLGVVVNKQRRLPPWLARLLGTA